MGWPNNDPGGWDEVCRAAVKEWITKGLQEFYGEELLAGVKFIGWLQYEHPKIFQIMVDQTGFALADAEADYLERKFSTGGEL